ncbi:hypothetical protein L596_018459 [Steinernema carpocapsae]|uniref:DNA topoisomerase 2 n=1 Tax=Steinernema carpocapsae TaxID=34508 RepID=A0A4V6A216_STECR|nr:hypothetical protein L596_018459 [Steinernema carpocapsae]
MTKRDISYVPGFLKIFDEILVNAADNKQRDKSMTAIRIDVDRCAISGQGNLSAYFTAFQGTRRNHDLEQRPRNPRSEARGRGCLRPFTYLWDASNVVKLRRHSTQNRGSGGRNGYGAKLCSIYSTEFHVETASSNEGLRFQQSWSDNMESCGPERIEHFEGKEDYTSIRFRPDLKRFGMTEIDDMTMELIRKRAFDVAATLDGTVEVFFNGQKLEISSFRDYVDLYHDAANHVEHCKVTPRWEIALTTSDSGFQQVSFVNNISTLKGGRHVDYVVDQIVDVVKQLLEENYKAKVRPYQIKSRLFLFLNCLIENPTFDSQTKETLTTNPKNFGSKCDVPRWFVLNAIEKTGIIEAVLRDINKREAKDLNDSIKRPHHIPKLEDANFAGTTRASECSLIVTEGDSAKALAIAGLGVIGRDRYGVFPIRGKLLNVRQVPKKKALDNAEVSALMQILGLKFGTDYSDPEELRKLRYGKLMIMVDQDQDGSHIKGLLINFLHTFWPELIRTEFVQCFITPLLKAKRGSEVKAFYRISDYNRWREESPEHKRYSVKYYKGLGTSTAAEARQYFSKIEDHRIQFEFGGEGDDEKIQMAFTKDMSDERKRWISDYIQAKANHVHEEIKPKMTYSDFVDNELVQFSEYDLRRSIPNLVDGMKPSQRKVLFACFKRPEGSEVKVNQLAGAVAQISAYHHGEESLVNTIVRLAQDFVGSNNLNLLQPIGQFGTRHQGGEDAASARYIYTKLSPVTRLLFPSADDDLLHYLTEDEQSVEPEWFCPIIPLILANGAEGIGTGWATNVLAYDPRVLITNVRRQIHGDPMTEMIPFYRGFKGKTSLLPDGKYEVRGHISRTPQARKNSNHINFEITELPVGSWTQTYKERVIQALLKKDLISGFKEYHSENYIRFSVEVPVKATRRRTNESFLKAFKLTSVLSSNQMWLFNSSNILRHYPRTEEVMEEFFDVRKAKYLQRKEFLEAKLVAQFERARNQHDFIDSIISGRLELKNRPISDIEAQLRQSGFVEDPVAIWKQQEPKRFRYLLDMPLGQLSEEEKRKLVVKMEERKRILGELQETSWQKMWMTDLEALEKEVTKILRS